MKANRTEQPQAVHTATTGKNVKILLRENITQTTDPEGETSWQYDEYILEIRDRPGIEQYINTNFAALMAKAKQDETAGLTADFEACLDKHIDSVAQDKSYDNRLTASLRAAAIESPWHAEGVAFVAWMDSCYATAYTILNAVQAGTRELPSKDVFISEMPEMVWP